MSGPEVGTNLPARMTKEEAGPMLPGMVWSEELGRAIPRGEAFAIDRARLEADPAFQIAQYDKRREALLTFVTKKLQEAEYDRGGYPLKGKMHDFYILPNYDKKTCTKGGASKVANLLRLRVAEKVVTNAAFTAEHGSARVKVILVDANNLPAGAHEAACSTAESGFQSDGVKKKYGMSVDRDGVVKPPDYRAAENDVVSRAGKRAFVGAVIVAASLEEIFDIETSTDAAGDEGEREQPEAPAAPKEAPKAAPRRTGGPTMAFGDHKGEPLSSENITVAELVKVRDWCERKDAVKWSKFIGELNAELDYRRDEP